MRNLSEQFRCISTDADIANVKAILKQRLPLSAHEYNTLLCKEWFPEGVEVYTLDGNVGPDAIVLLKHLRKDYGQDLSISAPVDYVPSEYFREALINTKAIDWEAAYFFTSVDTKISPVIVELSVGVKNNSIEYHSNYQFIIDADEALSTDIKLDKNVELRPLDESTGAKFLTNNWDSSKPGTMDYVQTVLKINPSAGVFVNGKLVCGALVNIHGMLGLLHTHQEYRRYGFALICGKFIFKEMAKLDMVPCSSAQRKNIKSVNFHKKLGMKLTHETNYILHHAPFKN